MVNPSFFLYLILIKLYNNYYFGCDYMVVRVGLIFKMKNFFVEGKKINVYKVQDIELGFNTLVNYTDCKDVNTFIRINATDNNNLLKIIIDSNKENLGEDFNREGYYAGLYDDEDHHQPGSHSGHRRRHCGKSVLQGDPHHHHQVL